MAKKPFKGVIKLDVRDSKPDWGPYMAAKAPEGAPNVLIVLYDDTGPGRLVALRRPHQHADPAEAGRQRPDLLAVAHDRALLADPSTFLTGRNHHLNGMAASPRRPTASPARHGRIPAQCATLAQMLQDNG